MYTQTAHIALCGHPRPFMRVYRKTIDWSIGIHLWYSSLRYRNVISDITKTYTVQVHAINVVPTRTHTLRNYFNIGRTIALTQPLCNSVTILQHHRCGIFTTVLQFCHTIGRSPFVHVLFQCWTRLEQNENKPWTGTKREQRWPPVRCVVLICSMRPFWGVFWKSTMFTIDTPSKVWYNSSTT